MSKDARNTDAAAEVWELTLATYAGEGVAAACIGLQDRHGVGVSVLLALTALAALDYPVPDERGMAVVLERAESWQRRVIEPLRASRRELPQAAPTLIADAAQTVARHLLAQEIETERLQQQLVVTDALAVSSGVTRVSPENVARLYLARFIEVWTEQEEAALRTLLAALVNAGIASPGA